MRRSGYWRSGKYVGAVTVRCRAAELARGDYILQLRQVVRYVARDDDFIEISTDKATVRWPLQRKVRIIPNPYRR